MHANNIMQTEQVTLLYLRVHIHMSVHVCLCMCVHTYVINNNERWRHELEREQRGWYTGELQGKKYKA